MAVEKMTKAMNNNGKELDKDPAVGFPLVITMSEHRWKGGGLGCDRWFSSGDHDEFPEWLQN